SRASRAPTPMGRTRAATGRRQATGSSPTACCISSARTRLRRRDSAALTQRPRRPDDGCMTDIGPPEQEAGAILTIYLGALVANWRGLREQAAPAHCAAVVKADAYGCGIEQVVPALAHAGCATFFVAHLSEARRARAASPDTTIYVLNGLLPGSAPAY